MIVINKGYPAPNMAGNPPQNGHLNGRIMCKRVGFPIAMFTRGYNEPMEVLELMFQRHMGI